MIQAPDNCLRLAMWSGPRNISTAMMRSFENRRDCEVVDEPFYAAYLIATGFDHPGRDNVIASQSGDWNQVIQHLLTERPAPVFFQKHMTQHLVPELDLSFTRDLHNCFLIRDPRKIILSYLKVRQDFELEELGFPQQLNLFELECDRLGQAPPVLDADLTLSNPERVLRTLCKRLSIEFETSMLHWPAGPRSTDGVWAPHWYSNVLKTTGFLNTPNAGSAVAGSLQASGSESAESHVADSQQDLEAYLVASGVTLTKPAGELQAMLASATEMYSKIRPYAIASY
ncbi:MAG: HAD family hydrolase [Pseudomonadota bacterium]